MHPEHYIGIYSIKFKKSHERQRVGILESIYHKKYEREYFRIGHSYHSIAVKNESRFNKPA